MIANFSELCKGSVKLFLQKNEAKAVFVHSSPKRYKELKLKLGIKNVFYVENMKNLKDYIKNYIKENYLDESVWDIEDNIEDDNKELILDSIKKFIKDNYINIKLKRCEFIFDEKKYKYIITKVLYKWVNNKNLL